jgi:hypothetical protein
MPVASQSVCGLGVDDAAAGDDQGPARSADRLHRTRELALLGRGPRNLPCPLEEELLRVVERLGLDVLGEGERDGAGLGGAGEDAHRRKRGGNHLLGPREPVEVPRDGPEAVVHRHVAGPRNFELLEDGIGTMSREDVSWEEQHRQPVDRRERGAGDHVRRPGADRARAHHGAETVRHPRVSGGDVHHSLLVPGLVVGQEIAVLEQRLRDPDVPVAEDAEASAEEPTSDTITRDVLRGEEAHERLRRRQPDIAHGVTLDFMGARCRSFSSDPANPTPTAPSSR